MIINLLVSLLGILALAWPSGSQNCGGTLEDAVGEMESPGYPEAYPPFSHCVWQIRAPPTRTILLSFVDFNLEATDDCVSGDFLTVEDSEGGSNVYCGRDHPWSIESKDNFLSVSFFSDADDEEGHEYRFKLSYITISKCLRNWQEFGSHCYFFSSDEKNFFEAKSNCTNQATGARLASVHSREEQVFLQTYAKRATLWLGAEPTGPGLNASPWNFDFIDGSPEDYHNVWGGEDPWILGGCNSSATCGIELVPDRWQNIDCQERKQVLCTSDVAYDGDWYDCDDFYVHLSSGKMNFYDAEQYCLDFPGAQMLNVSNDDQQGCLSLRFGDHFTTSFQDATLDDTAFWIGLTRANGTWEWVNGSPLQYERWDVGYPEGSSSDCAVMVTSSWEDSMATNNHSFVCKI
ncbi:unnamed protein product [Darwinula stevensoni]|uniref:Uncharacterized protein n=1 Tax=Darwinula stevensoni TaxID=69355 RepID=A0A7R8XLR4_9CRUS|nr:unnamed protein product [Darwinula stevensoni]CAG0894584.1 unnamed protein product [Darwinula stevensoni]